MRNILSTLLLVAASSPAVAEKTDLTLTGQEGVHQFFNLSSPWTEDMAYVSNVLQTACFGKPVCISHLWNKVDAAPTALPLSEKEKLTKLGMYERNTELHLSKLTLNCEKFEIDDKAQCI